MLDLEPATRTLDNIVAGVRDDQLAAAAPCRGVTLGALLDRVIGLTGRDPRWPSGANGG